MFVAWLRAAADAGITSIPGFSDPAARKLLTGFFWNRALRFADAAAANPRRRARLLPAVDGVVLRVAFLDTLLQEFALPQVVILGAGLDTRAWRLEVFRLATVWEVDHPATQSYKQARIPMLGPPIVMPHFVTVDFTKDDLEARLTAAGFRPEVPSIWVWEGVTMYLDEVSLRRSLQAIRGLSAHGSALLMHYHEPETKKRILLLRWLLFRWLGEPQIGARPRAQMQAEVRSAGFQVREDADIVGYAARTNGIPSTHPRARVSRILVATPDEKLSTDTTAGTR